MAPGGAGAAAGGAGDRLHEREIAGRLRAVGRGVPPRFDGGRNVAVEYRWAHGDYARLPALARELVDRKVAVLLGIGGDSSALAAKAATSTIPSCSGWEAIRSKPAWS